MSGECDHKMIRHSVGFQSCKCRHIRYYPFVSVQNLVSYYGWERGANKEQGLKLIIETYTGTKNKELVEVAQTRLVKEFNN